MKRRRAFLAALLATPFILWRSNAEDPKPKSPLPDLAWDFQVHVILDRPKLPEFKVEGVAKPGAGELALVVVLEAGVDPGATLEMTSKLAKGSGGVDAFWAAPDEPTGKLAAAAKAIPGSVSKEIDAFVAPGIRPAILVVAQDGRVVFAHFPGMPGETAAVSDEIAYLRHKVDPKVASPVAPAPGHEYRGALACAACHRAQFVDWLITPHSLAFEGLTKIGRDNDESCLSCHVAGFRTGGFTTRATDRKFADVQCEACHVPDRLHAGDRKMKSADYAARCTTCHEGAFSLVPHMDEAVPMMSHPAAGSAELATSQIRDQNIAKIRGQMYFEFCSRCDYVGSAACKECHEKSHAAWSSTPHAGAFKTLEAAHKSTEPGCVRCHVSGIGHVGGFVGKEKTPGMAEVGCESCHGPGRHHLDAKTREDRLASIFRFDEKCPTCVVSRICQACHDAQNDPGFDLAKSLERVKHRDK